MPHYQRDSPLRGRVCDRNCSPRRFCTLWCWGAEQRPHRLPAEFLSAIRYQTLCLLSMPRPERCLRPFRLAAVRSELSSLDGRKVYTSNFMSASVSVIDTVNLVVTATIRVPPRPQESDITIDGTRLFVVHHHDQVVSVIDLATDTVIQVIPIGVGPAAGFNSDRHRFYTKWPLRLGAQLRNVVDFIDTTRCTKLPRYPPERTVGEWPLCQMGNAPSSLTSWVIRSRRLTCDG